MAPVSGFWHGYSCKVTWATYDFAARRLEVGCSPAVAAAPGSDRHPGTHAVVREPCAAQQGCDTQQSGGRTEVPAPSATSSLLVRWLSCSMGYGGHPSWGAALAGIHAFGEVVGVGNPCWTWPGVRAVAWCTGRQRCIDVEPVKLCTSRASSREGARQAL
jgi:hypothetical protein